MHANIRALISGRCSFFSDGSRNHEMCDINHSDVDINKYTVMKKIKNIKLKFYEVI